MARLGPAMAYSVHMSSGTMLISFHKGGLNYDQASISFLERMDKDNVKLVIDRTLKPLVGIMLVLSIVFSIVGCSTPAADQSKTAAKEGAKPAASTAEEESKPAAAKQEAKPTAAAKEAAKTSVPAAKPSEFATPKEKMTIKLAHNMPVKNVIARSMDRFAQNVSQWSKGQITVEVYPAGQLYTEKDIPQAILTKSIDIGVVIQDLIAEMVPGADVFTQPFLFKSDKQFTDALNGALGKRWAEGAEAKGFHTLGFVSAGWAHTFSVPRQLKTVDDFKGMKMRAMGGAMAEALKAMGAAPVFMGAGEVYTALQRKTVDGYVSSITSTIDRKFYEVSKYAQINRIGTGLLPIMYNKASWDALSPEAKKIIEAAAKDAADWEWVEQAKEEEAGIKVLKDNGMEVIETPADQLAIFKKLTAPVLDSFAAKGDLAKELLKLAKELQ